MSEEHAPGVEAIMADVVIIFPTHFRLARWLAHHIARCYHDEWRRIRVFHGVMTLLRAAPRVVPVRSRVDEG